jgi:sugar/nucleoside kinase (ribokinase family)
MVPLELDGDRLDERIVLERVPDLAPDVLDELEELFRIEFGVVDEEDVGEDVRVAFVEFVEVQVMPRRGSGGGQKVYQASGGGPSVSPSDEIAPPRTPHVESPQVVVVGAACRDVARDDPRGWRMGGGVTYGALTVARLGLTTAALIGVDEAAEKADELDLLRSAGVDVRTVALARGPVFQNIERPERRLQISHSVSDPVPVAALPADWRHAPGWILAPVADELPDDWAAVPDEQATVAVGWQGLLRVLGANRPVEHLPPTSTPIIRRADLVGVSRDDLERHILIAELCALLRPGATLAVTQGVNGGLVMEATPDGPARMRHYPAVPTAGVVDATGAGDVFLAALAAARIEPRLVGGRIAHGHDVLLAAAAASLVLEAEGLLGVPDRDAVRQRVRAGLVRSAGRRRPPGDT